MAVAANVRKGGSWLLEDTEPTTVFTPEKLSEEHRLMARTVEEFVSTEVMPKIDQLESKDWKLARELVRRAGELGLLGISVPEQYSQVPSEYGLGATRPPTFGCLLPSG